jgi:hypothetical protein
MYWKMNSMMIVGLLIIPAFQAAECNGAGMNDKNGECMCANGLLHQNPDSGKWVCCPSECGVCGGDGTSCVGCTYLDACNFDPFATSDDGSCDYTSCIVPGCTYDNACNYNVEATLDDGSCTYSDDPCYDCDGAMIKYKNHRLK